MGGFSADEIEQLIETCNERAKPGEIAAVELNASCHNVNFPFGTILEEALRRAVPKSRHPVILKVSPDEDYHWQANLAATYGCAAITAINTVKGLRLRPGHRRAVPEEPLRGDLRARDQADRAAGRGGAARRRASGCRSSRTAGSATSTTAASTSGRAPMPCRLGSAVWLQPMPLYALGPVEGLRIRRLIDRVARFTPPATAPHWEPAATRASPSAPGPAARLAPAPPTPAP